MSWGGCGTDELGITPVVATLLLIGLTIAAVSTVAVVVGQIPLGSGAPHVELGNIRAELVQASATNFVTRISFTNQGGEFLWPKELRVTINGVDNNGNESSTSIKSTADNLIKFGSDTSWLLANWQDFSTAEGDPYYENGKEVEIFIVHDPSGTVLADVTRVVTGPVYHVYSDSGIPPDSEIWTWDGGGGTHDGDYTGETPPEGSKCFETYSANWAGWGVFLIYPAHHTVDLSSYSYLKFWVKTPANLKVEVEDVREYPTGNASVYINSHGWDGTDTWQEIIIPLQAFVDAKPDLDTSKIYSVFKVTIESSGTFYIDHVQWV